jgi:hypothetical protein
MNRIGRATDPELRTDLVAELILMTFRSSSRRVGVWAGER